MEEGSRSSRRCFGKQTKRREGAIYSYSSKAFQTLHFTRLVKTRTILIWPRARVQGYERDGVLTHVTHVLPGPLPPYGRTPLLFLEFPYPATAEVPKQGYRHGIGKEQKIKLWGVKKVMARSPCIIITCVMLVHQKWCCTIQRGWCQNKHCQGSLARLRRGVLSSNEP